VNNVFTIEKLFADRVFRVPDYQRGYAWEEQQLAEFIEDVELLPAERDHYTGTVVLHDRKGQKAFCLDEEGKHYAVSEVVDGQQRLTTIVLLLDAVRREMAGIEPLAKLADGIRKSYVEVSDQANQPLHKLVLNRDCQDYFSRNVLGDQPGPEGPSIQSHRRLTVARDFFAGYLSDQRKKLGVGYESWLRGIRTKVVQHLKVTLYTVEDQAEVGVIFEVLNNRGKPLSELEKVKNYLLFLASKLNLPQHKLADEVNRAWTHVFERLMQADLTSADAKEEDQLLRSHWLMAYDHLRKNWDGSKSIKARFNLRPKEISPQTFSAEEIVVALKALPEDERTTVIARMEAEAGGKGEQDDHKALLRDLIEYAQTLERASLAFCDVQKPGRTDAFAAWKGDPALRKKVIAASEKLRRIRVVAPFLPLLIAARLRFPTDGQRYLELVQLCEVFAFRVYRLHGYRSNAGQSSLFRFGRLLYLKEYSFDDVLTKLRGLLLHYSSAQSFQVQFKLDEEYNWYKWPGLKYFLYEYEEYLAKGEAPRLSWDDLEQIDLEKTIEHVLPQTPTDPYWTQRFDEAAQRKWTNDIANFCLTSHNASYGNKPFPEKKGSPGDSRPCYANANLFMERALAAFPDWNEAALTVRRQAIVEWALKRWHVEETASVEPEAQDERDDSED
jgi:hypothetical protein